MKNDVEVLNCGSLLAVLMLALAVLIVPASAQSIFLQTAGQAASSAGTDQSVKTASGAYPMQTFILNYANAKDMANSFSGILGEGEVATVNEKLNALVVRAADKTLKRMADLIKKLDIPPLQVQVEAKIIELKSGSGDTNNPSALGVEWKYNKNTNTYIQLTDVVTGSASTLGLYAQLLSGNTAAYLNALEKSIGYDLVASPWITALNHEESSILIGSKYGYKTTLTTQTGTMQNVNFLEVGTRLRFTPHINDDGYIIMEIYPSVSEGSVTNDLPQENTTETRNKVLVKDGQSIVIGGLTKNYHNEVEIGVPVLSSLPFIGMLFKRTELKSEKREIMVLITPHIVTPEFLEAMSQNAQTLEQKRDKWAKDKAKLIH